MKAALLRIIPVIIAISALALLASGALIITNFNTTVKPEADVVWESVPEEEQAATGDSDEADEFSKSGQETVPAPVPGKVKGIYLSAWLAGMSVVDEYIAHIDETELNAVVIDVKNDDGNVTFHMGTPTVEELESSMNIISDIDGLISKLHEHDIYVIARVVAFRDPYLKDKKPEWMIKNASGAIYIDNQGFAWPDPQNRDMWDYLVEVALGAADAGFDEIQFDYVRYSTGITDEMIGIDGEKRQGIIADFAEYAAEAIHEAGIPVSLDVFGTIISSDIDRDIVGQNYGLLSSKTDVLSPMVYPSHYYDGAFDLDHPDLYPYETVTYAMDESVREITESSDISGNDPASSGEGEPLRAAVRPWLQGFTASYLRHYKKYTAEDIRAQIKAVYDSGYDEWLIWNPSCKYIWEAFEE